MLSFPSHAASAISVCSTSLWVQLGVLCSLVPVCVRLCINHDLLLITMLPFTYGTMLGHLRKAHLLAFQDREQRGRRQRRKIGHKSHFDLCSGDLYWPVTATCGQDAGFSTLTSFSGLRFIVIRALFPPWMLQFPHVRAFTSVLKILVDLKIPFTADGSGALTREERRGGLKPAVGFVLCGTV